MPAGRNPRFCPQCHCNVFPDNNGFCFICDSMTTKRPEHRRAWADRATRNEDHQRKMMDYYWEKGEGADATNGA